MNGSYAGLCRVNGSYAGLCREVRGEWVICRALPGGEGWLRALPGSKEGWLRASCLGGEHETWFHTGGELGFPPNSEGKSQNGGGNAPNPALC